MGTALPVLNLDDVRVASPCTASWAQMKGTERVRFCGQCEKSVYNLSGMTRGQATQLLQDTEGKVCVRFYRRADGTMLTQDCPVGLAAALRRAKRATFGAIAASLGAAATLLAFISFGGGATCRRGASTLRDAAAQLLGHVDQLPMGEIAGGLAPMPMQGAPAPEVKGEAVRPTLPEPAPMMGSPEPEAKPEMGKVASPDVRHPTMGRMAAPKHTLEKARFEMGDVAVSFND